MNENAAEASASFLLHCPDRPGVVAAVSAFIAEHKGNIIHAEQHIDKEAEIFFQRVEFSLQSFQLAREEIQPAFAQIAEEFKMDVSLNFSDESPPIGILCSKQGHCLHDLLGRWYMGELPGRPAFVASNHTNFKDITERMGVPFHHLPVTKETKAEQEAELLKLTASEGIELLVMARYMQILSDDFLQKFPGKVINIHHSFLPAFPGAKPYHQALKRGVKIVGATAHYATADLDEGPIIAQDTVPVDHRDNVEDLLTKGRDLEMVVLAKAVRAHLEHRVLTYGNKTVVFS